MTMLPVVGFSLPLICPLHAFVFPSVSLFRWGYNLEWINNLRSDYPLNSVSAEGRTSGLWTQDSLWCAIAPQTNVRTRLFGTEFGTLIQRCLDPPKGPAKWQTIRSGPSRSSAETCDYYRRIRARGRRK
jgi:hypothetical protein